MTVLSRTTALTAVLMVLGGAASAQTADNAVSQGSGGAQSTPTVCDQPWIKVDGNEDGFVNRDEASQAIDQQFGQIDTDGNDEITKTEWVDCLSRNRDQVSAEADRSEENFASVDQNQDGNIDAGEYREGAEQAFKQMGNAGSGASDASGNDASASDSAAAGGDQNPIIVLRRFVWLTPDEANNPGSIGDMSEDEIAGRSAANFSSLDSNGDGILDTQEWSQRSTASMSENHASARFDTMDSNASGSISRGEYAAAREATIGSETTASTNAASSGASGTSSSSASGSHADQSDSAGQASRESGSAGSEDVPVFIYRFMPM